MIRLYHLLLILFLGHQEVSAQVVPPEATNSATKINGINLMPPIHPHQEDYTPAIEELGGNWVSLVCYIHGYMDSPNLDYQQQARKWGESEEGLAYHIEIAHQKGLNIMLKPSVWLPAYGWPGDFRMDNETEWKQWEKNYRNYIIPIVRLATEKKVAMICIGTEMKQTVKKRESFWRELISEIRSIYNGQLTYSANWDNFQQVPFWDQLDLIGINAYFPLSADETPTVEKLKQAWQTPLRSIKNIQSKYNKAILFTEFGYPSLSKGVWKQWEIQDASISEPVNLQLQLNAYQALLETFWAQDWFAGGFLWQWWVFDEQAGGLYDNTYTPQNKPVEKIIRQYYAPSIIHR